MKTILNSQLPSARAVPFSILHCLCLLLCGCITEFEAKHTEEISDVLVVEGIISDDESVIILSRSAGLNHDDTQDMSAYSVPDATVYVECDDGTQWEATFHPDWDLGFGKGNGSRYTVETGKLNPERQYRMKIEMEAHEYCSEFAGPMITPEIDSVFWTKKAKEQPVNINVATHAADSMVRYYRWLYREDWETRAKIPTSGYLSSCSKHNNSREILLGTTEKTAFGRLTYILAAIPPSDDRFEFLYRMDVTQIAISKRAFDYYTNIKKNAQQTGGIFAHIPSEIKGNITCITDSNRPVIGYMDVSSATRARLYIYRSEGVYETYTDCPIYPLPTIREYFGTIPYNYVFTQYGYAERRCVDCQVDGGRPIGELPDDWPYKYGED